MSEVPHNNYVQIWK